MVLGVSLDKPATNEKFATKYEFGFDLLTADKAMARAYGAVGWIPFMAKRISYLIGPDGKIVKAYPSVKPAEHPEQVLADLR